MKKQKCLFFEIISLTIIKMRVKMKNRSHRYDINRTRSRHDYKYTKYKMYLSMMMIMCNNEAELITKLSNTDTELEKALLIKKRVFD